MNKISTTGKVSHHHFPLPPHPPQADCPILNLFHNVYSTQPFFAIYLGKNDWQMTQPKLQHGRNPKEDNVTSPTGLLGLQQRNSPASGGGGGGGGGGAIGGGADDLSSGGGGVELTTAATWKKLHSIKFLHVRFKEKYSFLTKRDQLLLKSPAGFRVSVCGC